MSLRAFLLLLIGLTLAFISGLKCQEVLSQMDEIGEATILVTKLPSNSKNQSLYFVTKRWGLTGDHQVIALTDQKPEMDKWAPNQATDYIWEGSVEIYYQTKDDIIKIWASNLPDTTKQKYASIQFIQIRGGMFEILKNETSQAIKFLE